MPSVIDIEWRARGRQPLSRKRILDKGSAGTVVQSAFEAIMARYSNARRTDRLRKKHPVCALLAEATGALAVSKQGRRFPNVLLKWSAGQGSWAFVPWIAALDARETSRTSSGVYLIYLFRVDLTGVYLTLNQGVTGVTAEFGYRTHEVLRHRSATLATYGKELLGRGFGLGGGVDLRHDTPSVRAYEAGAVAHKLYERGAVPADDDLLQDFEALLDVYDKLVPSQRFLKSDE